MISKNKSNEKSSMRLLAFVPLSIVMVVVVIGLKGLLPDAAKASNLAETQVNSSDADSTKTLTVESVWGDKFTYFLDGKKIANDNIWPEGIHSVVVDTVTNTVNFYTKAEAVNTIKEEPQALPDFSKTQIFIDGVEQTDKDILSKMDQNTIESVDVIKDQAMVKQYTSKKCDGVIIIKTKK